MNYCLHPVFLPTLKVQTLHSEVVILCLCVVLACVQELISVLHLHWGIQLWDFTASLGHQLSPAWLAACP